MPEPQVEHVSDFGWEGLLGPAAAVALGLAFAVLFGLAYWYERRRARTGVAPLLLALRVAAVGLVLLMLTGPTARRITRVTQPRSVIVAADVSGSMGVVDGEAYDRPTRWDLAADPEGDGLAAADRLRLAAAVLSTRIAAAADALEAGRRAEVVTGHLDAARRAASRTAEHARRIPPGGGSDRDGKEIAARLDEVVLPALDDLRDEPGVVADWQARADALRAAADRVRRDADRIAEAAAEAWAAQASAGESPRSRRDQVFALLGAGEGSWLRPSGSELGVRRAVFDADVRSVSSFRDVPPAETASGGEPAATDLSAVLRRVVDDAARSPVEAVVLLTDGQHQPAAGGGDRRPLDVVADGSPVPIYTVPVGSSRAAKDLVLHHLQAPDAVLEGDRIVIKATCTAFECGGEAVTVELLEDGGVIDRWTATVEGDRNDVPIEFEVETGRTGERRFELIARPVAAEADEGNNRAAATVRVNRETLKVFLTDRTPRWEHRYLLNLFRRDEHVEFVDTLVWNLETPDRPTAAPLPTGLDEWARFDAAILGDIGPETLTPERQRELAEWVTERGGALLVIAGRESMPDDFAGQPLADLLPVVPGRGGGSGRHAMVPTPEGLANPAMRIGGNAGETERVWREVSRRLPVHAISAYHAPKPAARTLIDAVPDGEAAGGSDRRALLSWHRAGRGRVVFLAAPVVYQLRFRFGDEFHYRFWGQLLRWAVSDDHGEGSRLVRISTDRGEYESGEPVEVVATLSLPDGRPVAGGSLTLTAARSDRTVAATPFRPDPAIPGRYLAELRDLPTGPVRLTADGDAVTELLNLEGQAGPVAMEVFVEPPRSAEMFHTRCDRPLLKQIAEATGGLMIEPTAVAEVLRLVRDDPVVTETIERRPLWARWSLLWLVAGCLCVEWALRKRSGLA